MEQPPAPPTPPPPAFGTIQSHLDAATAGDVILVPPGTYKERVYVRRSVALGLSKGTVIDVTGLGVPQQSGGLTPLVPCTIFGYGGGGGLVRGSTGAGLDVSNVSDVLVVDLELADNVQEGYHLNACRRVTFVRLNTHNNNVALTVDPGWEAGGGKASGTSDIRFLDSVAHHNGGPGFWQDGYCRGTKLVNCTAHHNSRVGIFDELSDGSEVAYGASYENGWEKGQQIWAWGAGLLGSTSMNGHYHHHVLAWNADGLSVIWQNRGEKITPVGNWVHDNVIAVSRQPVDTSDIKALAFMSDAGATLSMFDPTAENRAERNQLYRGDSSTPVGGTGAYRYDWNGSRTTMAAANAVMYANGPVPANALNTEITQAAMQALLQAAGVPITPEPHT